MAITCKSHATILRAYRIDGGYVSLLVTSVCRLVARRWFRSCEIHPFHLGSTIFFSTVINLRLILDGSVSRKLPFVASFVSALVKITLTSNFHERHWTLVPGEWKIDSAATLFFRTCTIPADMSRVSIQNLGNSATNNLPRNLGVLPRPFLPAT